jgi:hypothetical protein
MALGGDWSNVFNKTRGCKAIEVGRRHDEIKARLMASADESIDAASSALEIRIRQAEQSRNFGSSRDNAAIENWLSTARAALQQLHPLKLTALSGSELENEIERIISNVPASW